MHEAGITKAIVDSIIKECEKNHIKNPKKIIIELGGLSSYDKEHLMYHLNPYINDISLISKSEFIINEINGKIKCRECKKESDVEYSELIQCPHCESIDIEVIQGKDIKIISVEV